MALRGTSSDSGSSLVRFGVPADAELPHPARSGDVAAIAEVLQAEKVVGLAMFAAQEWTRRRTSKDALEAARVLPEVIIVWTPPLDGLEFEDAILTDIDEFPISSGVLRWKGRDLDLRWLSGPAAADVMAEFFQND